MFPPRIVAPLVAGAVLSASASVRVSVDGSGKRFVETVVAANPRDSASLVAAAIVLGDGGTSVAAYSSADRGDHWTPSSTTFADGGRTDGIDPWVLFTHDGTALFAYLAGERPDNFAVSRSLDGGRSWRAPAYVPGGLYDREYLVEDWSADSKYRGTIYAIGKINVVRLGGRPFQEIAVSTSKDAAVTFSSPLLFVPPDDNEPLIVVANSVVGRDGTLVIPFTTVIRPLETDTMLDYGLWTIRSSDGGRTFTAPSLVARRIIPKSDGQRQSSVPSAAIDASTGRIYLTWSLKSAGGYDIVVWQSSDLGTTWSTGVRVNDNARAADHVNPAVAVNSRGTVLLAWYDRRDSNDPTCHSLRIAESYDGARTFLSSLGVTTVQTCVQSTRFANAGDTLGLVAATDDAFHVAFISGTNASEMQLYSARILAAPNSAHSAREAGGESGIRTHGRVSPTHAFQACSFNHSDISPCL